MIQASKKVAMLIPCFVDQMSPQIGFDMASVLRRIGYTVEFEEQQTCCGQPAFNTGYWNEARPLAEKFVRLFREKEFIVCPSASCTTMVRNFYPELLANSPAHDDAVELGKRVFEFSEFLVNVARVTDVGATFAHRVTYHDSCHALRELHLKQPPRELLRHVRGLEVVEMKYSEDCCGFGGTFSTKFSMISAAMGDTKAGNVEACGAEFVTSVDPSCLMQIDGILRRRKSPTRAIHLASILACCPDSRQPSLQPDGERAQ
jgi:L-lactate dehydrogenase complex protein LldE